MRVNREDILFFTVIGGLVGLILLMVASAISNVMIAYHAIFGG